MHYLKKYFIAIFCFCCLNSISQTIDSLNKVILKNANDTNAIKAHYLLAKIYTDKQDSANAVNNYLTGIAKGKKIKAYKFIGFGLNELGYLYELMNENSTAKNYYQQALINGKQHNLYASTAKAYSNIAFININTGKLQVAAIYLDSSLINYQNANNLLEVGNVLNNQGLVYQNLGQQEKALVNYQKAINIYDAINAERKKSNTILNIGKIYLDQKNNDIALKYFNQALPIAQRNNNYASESLIQNNIGVAYYNKKDFHAAITYFEKAVSLSKKTNNKKQELETITNIGSSYDLLGDIDNAIKYYKKAEPELININNYEGLVTNYINQSSSLGKQKKYTEALGYCYKTLNLIKANEGVGQYKHFVYETMAAIYKEQGNLKLAFEYQDSQIMAKNEYINEQANTKLLDLQTKYETEKKEYKINLLSKADSINALRINNQILQINQQQFAIVSQNLQLNKQQLLLAEDSIALLNKTEIINRKEAIEKQQQHQLSLLAKEKEIKDLEIKQKNLLTYGLIALLLATCLGGYVFYRFKQAQQKNMLQQKLLEQEKQATVNILAAEEKERQRIATDLHDGVGQILTATWLNLQQINEEAQKANSPNKDFVERTLNLMNEGCKEVRAVSHNMMPNALLKKGLIDAVREFIQQLNTKQTQINLQTQGLQKKLPNHVEAVLYRVIQESVNNVIKHAQATRLDISIGQEDNGEIDVMIEDNGIGFNVQEALKKEGIGLQNIKSRIEFLKGTVQWDSNANNGTLVAIHIPSNNE